MLSPGPGSGLPHGGGGAAVPTLERPELELIRWFAEGPAPLVALSGGVDSAVVAALALRAVPGRARAATLVGPAVAPSEVDRAVAVARRIGIPHELVPVDPLVVAGYRSNPADRCYFCRSIEAAALRARGAELGIGRYVDGVHRDDLGDDRPGLRALNEAGFEHPLLWAGWGKGRIREVARVAGLPNWDAPADACLASRIPHGTVIDAETLSRVAAAEEACRSAGFVRVRVRVLPGGARVEVGPEELPRLRDPALRDLLTARLGTIGFARVEFDPRGYRVRANS